MITVEDYLGGIADLTGELMRLAIGSVGRSLTTGADGESEDGLSSIASIGRTVREIKGGKSTPSILAIFSRLILTLFSLF